MRRILLSCAGIAVLLLPAASAAGAHRHARPGFVVVRRATGDGGAYGHPVVTLVVRGFVLGSVSQQQARVDIYHLPSAAGGGGPQVSGADVTRTTVHWRRFTGVEYNGSGFRFRASGGSYRVVVRGSGIYLFAGGHGVVTVHGSTVYPHSDGKYSIDGGKFRSLPARPLRRALGGG